MLEEASVVSIMLSLLVISFHSSLLQVNYAKHIIKVKEPRRGRRKGEPKKKKEKEKKRRERKHTRIINLSTARIHRLEQLVYLLVTHFLAEVC